jgi:hypothetical protein
VRCKRISTKILIPSFMPPPDVDRGFPPEGRNHRPIPEILPSDIVVAIIAMVVGSLLLSVVMTLLI